MIAHLSPTSEGTDDFGAAAEALRRAQFRSELTVREIPAPERIAPQAIAFAAGVTLTGAGTAGYAAEQTHDVFESPEGAGRLILMHNPQMRSEWDSDFRLVCYAQAPLDVEIGADPFITDVAWSWLVDALESRSVEYTLIAGTVTKTLSAGYGSLAEQGEGSQLELRASWSPVGSPHTTDFAAHASAWSELLCLLAGLPLAEGVASLGTHRSRKAQHPAKDPRL